MDPDYPWPDKYKAEEHGFLAFLSKFKDVPNKKAKPVTLPFERPLQELEAKIIEVGSFTFLLIPKINNVSKPFQPVGFTWILVPKAITPLPACLIVYHVCAGIAGSRIG